MKFSDAVECLDKGGKVRLKGQKGYYFVGLTESHHMDLFFSTPGLLEPTRVVLTYKEIKTIDWEIVDPGLYENVLLSKKAKVRLTNALREFEDNLEFAKTARHNYEQTYEASK